MNHRDKPLAPEANTMRLSSPYGLVFKHTHGRTHIVNLPELIPTCLPQPRWCETADHRNNLFVSTLTKGRGVSSRSHSCIVTVMNWDGSRKAAMKTTTFTVAGHVAERPGRLASSCRSRCVRARAPAALSLYIPLFLTCCRAYAKPVPVLF